MTNGEKIQTILDIDKDCTEVYGKNGMMTFSVTQERWEAEYKEPITRNCFGCKYSKDNHNAGTEECHLCMWENQYTPTTKNDLAQERYQDLIEYFGDEKVAKTILESRKEFKAWLKRLRWNVKRADELARELEQIKETTENDLAVDCISREQALEPYKILENTDTLSVYSIRQNLAELPSIGRYDPYTDKFRKE